EDILDVFDVVEPASSPSGSKRPADLEIFDLVEGGEADEGSSVNFERSPTEKPSGVDIIAEGLESQVGAGRKKGDTPEEDTVVPELMTGPDSAAVDLGTGAGTPPVPIEISEDLLIPEDEAVDLGGTQPYDVPSSKKSGTEEVVVDESLL